MYVSHKNITGGTKVIEGVREERKLGYWGGVLSNVTLTHTHDPPREERHISTAPPKLPPVHTESGTQQGSGNLSFLCAEVTPLSYARDACAQNIGAAAAAERQNRRTERAAAHHTSHTCFIGVLRGALDAPLLVTGARSTDVLPRGACCFDRRDLQ